MDTSDIEQFAKLFDTAMTSDNPAVKKAFKNLLMVSALTEANNDEYEVAGPLQKMVNTIKSLDKRIDTLEKSQYNTSSIWTTTPAYSPTYTVDTLDDISITFAGDDELIKDEEC
jgi:hypothetical protein